MKNLNKIAILALLVAIYNFTGCKKDLITSPGKTAASTSSTSNSTANTKMVLFPGAGWVPANRVHLIEKGYYLMKKNGHILKMEKASAKMVEDFGEINKPVINQQVNTNNSAVNTPKLVNQAAYNSHYSVNNKNKGPEAAGANPNWITYANWKNPKSNGPITSFSTTWRVPGAPDSVASQSIFIFNGLQDTTSEGDVIQPVLGWGPNGIGSGGNFWYVTNSYATAGPIPYYFYTSPDTVYQGNSVTGLITYNGLHAPDDSYNYTSSFTGHSNSLVLVEGGDYTTDPTHEYAPYIPELNRACETLEAYTLGNHGVPQSPKLYPGEDSLVMSSIKIKVSSGFPSLTSPAWTKASTADTIHGQKTVIVSSANPNGVIDLYFHTKPTYPVLAYTTPDVYTVGTTITPLRPTNTGGAPTSYSASSLPAGLSLNTTTGVISGTPSIASSLTTYTITATNSSGSGTFPIQIIVSVQAPIISYTSPDSLYTGFPITALSPTNTGGAPTGYSISPALPSALSLNTSTGVISGTPNGAPSSGSYTVTATNAGGNGTFPITINILASNTITFDVSSTAPGNATNDFSLWVNSVNESGPRGVSQTNPIVISGYGYSSTSTVVMEFTFGPMPTSATLYNLGAPINGVISGSNITFSNVNLSAAGTGEIYIN